MNKIVYDINLIKVMSLFETVTRAKLKDCIKNPSGFLFVVEQNEVGKAVGSHGKNVHSLENALKSRVKIVEFNDNPVSFIKNLIYPLQVAEVVSVDGNLVLTAQDSKTRGMLIGRNATTLRSFEAIVQRYFPVNEVKVN